MVSTKSDFGTLDHTIFLCEFTEPQPDNENEGSKLKAMDNDWPRYPNQD